ncbi:hypothetical protein OQA88_6940 [Cercophora sp. LCS_1]
MRTTDISILTSSLLNMHLLRRAIWCLIGLATLSSAASVVEIDVVFPRNATYAPSKYFPIVLAVQNAALAENLKLHFRSEVWNGSKFREHAVGSPILDLMDISTKANVSSDYLLKTYINLSGEGQHGFVAWLDWSFCNENIGTPPAGDSEDRHRAYDPMLFNTTGVDVVFTIKKDAPEVDLVAATSDERACLAQPRAQPAFAITLSGQTREYPAFKPNGGEFEVEGGTCEVLPAVSTTTANPCRASISAAAAESMAAALHGEQCLLNLLPRDECSPKPNGAVRPLAVATVASLTAALSVMGFFLV